jgi:hypothetical protein
VALTSRGARSGDGTVQVCRGGADGREIDSCYVKDGSRNAQGQISVPGEVVCEAAGWASAEFGRGVESWAAVLLMYSAPGSRSHSCSAHDERVRTLPTNESSLTTDTRAAAVTRTRASLRETRTNAPQSVECCILTPLSHVTTKPPQCVCYAWPMSTRVAAPCRISSPSPASSCGGLRLSPPLVNHAAFYSMEVEVIAGFPLPAIKHPQPSCVCWSERHIQHSQRWGRAAWIHPQAR